MRLPMVKGTDRDKGSGDLHTKKSPSHGEISSGVWALSARQRSETYVFCVPYVASGSRHQQTPNTTSTRARKSEDKTTLDNEERSRPWIACLVVATMSRSWDPSENKRQTIRGTCVNGDLENKDMMYLWSNASHRE